MPEPILVIMPAMPLRAYVDSWPGIDKAARDKWYAKLEALAGDKKLDGAYKQGRIWFINLLAHAQKGLRLETEEDAEVQTPTPAKATSRPRVSDPAPRPLVRENPKRGAGQDRDAELRHRRRSS